MTQIIDIEKEKFLKAEEVADILNCSPNNVYLMIKRGEIPSITYGSSKRIPKSLLEQWVNSQLNTASVEA